MNIWLFLISCVLTNNFIFSKFLGCCPFLGVSSKVETAASMGIAVTFVMTLASLFAYMVNAWILVTLHLEYMQTIAFILVIASLVQFVEMVLKKSMPAIYSALGIYLPLITTNCAVLGVATLNVTNQYNMLYSVLNGTFSALGFLLAIVLMGCLFVVFAIIVYALRRKLIINQTVRMLSGMVHDMSQKHSDYEK